MERKRALDARKQELSATVSEAEAWEIVEEAGQREHDADEVIKNLQSAVNDIGCDSTDKKEFLRDFIESVEIYPQKLDNRVSV